MKSKVALVLTTSLVALWISVVAAGSTGDEYQSLVPAAPQVADEILFDGEPGSVPLPCEGENIEETDEAAHNSSRSLKLTPDEWYEPFINLYCADDKHLRRNLSEHDTIEFYMRAANPANPPAEPAFSAYNYEHESQIVPILDYIDGGVLDGAWRLVSIPLDDLKTANWDLNNVGNLKWSTDLQSRASYVDDIIARDLTPLVLRDVLVESHSYVRILLDERFDPDIARDPDHYTVVSTTDSNYASPQQPVAVGFEWRVVDFAGEEPQGSENAPVLHYDIILRLPTPLQADNDYILTIEGVVDPNGAVMPTANEPLAFDPDALNPNIKVNQIGYLPNSPKWGYVGGYLGDIGGGIWAVGEDGVILHWRPGSDWTTTQPSSATLRAVHALTEDDVWSVGDGGAVLHWDGGAWQIVDVSTTADFYDIHFTPQAEGWMVGSGGMILHWPPGGSVWESVSSPTSSTLRGVYASDAATAWAVGDTGTFLRWNGTAWEDISGQAVASDTLHDIGGFSSAGVWAVGDAGTILELTDDGWQTFPSPVSITLRQVSSDATGVAIIVGDNGVLLQRGNFDYGEAPRPFEQQTTPGTADLNTLVFLDARRGFTFGSDNQSYRLDFALPDHIPEGGDIRSVFGLGDWAIESLPSTATIHGATALPYGALRVADYLTLAPTTVSEQQISPTTVDIVDAAGGQIVDSVPLVLRAANWHLSGEDVYAFDFSALTTTGTYYARVPGFGISDPFVIGPDAYSAAAITAARGLYHQRCGEALTGTDYTHGECHLNDAVYHASVTASPLHNGEVIGNRKVVTGGWHDAGDYGKYVPTGVAALSFLLNSYELSLSLYGNSENPAFGNNWDIPDSNDAVPDLLEEAKEEMDWLVSLQDPVDGGVYHKVTTATWFNDMPELNEATRYIFAKTTQDTALTAAILAQGSRVWKDYDSGLAQIYLERAKKAWEFLEAHPDVEPAEGYANPEGVFTGEYGDPYGDEDERAWAAAELFRTTGNTDYHDDFVNYWSQNSILDGENEWQDYQQKASWAYVNTDATGVDVARKADIRQAFITQADEFANFTETNAYHNGARFLGTPEWIGWGVFNQSTRYAFKLMQGYALTNDSRYWKAALINLNTQLGANPLSMSFITGIGARYPMDPLHMPSMYDGIDEPVPGLPVYGVQARMTYDNAHQSVAQADENSYPHASDASDPYPILRRYIDTNELPNMAEFTVLEMGWTSGALGLLAAGNGDPPIATTTPSPTATPIPTQTATSIPTSNLYLPLLEAQ